MGWGNESLFAGSRLHDQDGRHAHKSKKSSKFFSGTSRPSVINLGM